MKHKIASGFKPTFFLLSLFLSLFAFGGSPALAHNTFDSSSPFEGETIESSPRAMEHYIRQVRAA